MNKPRRLRRNPAVRNLFSETTISPRKLVVPLFIVPREKEAIELPSMPGIRRYTPSQITEVMDRHIELGLKAFLLFGTPERKDRLGRSSANVKGVVPTALRLARKRFQDEVVLMADVCLCGYAEHGHCGVPDEAGHILNEASLPLLADAAVTYAQAGADIVAPSDMMDGRVKAIRDALDESFPEVGILSYAAKYASAYYGPFRDAVGSAPAFGDRKTYQMDPRNSREAIREIIQDEKEGADAVMVKPALAYLDVISAVRRETTLPLAAYNVSGEYSMVKAAAAAGCIDEGRVVAENLTAIFRAGADIVVSYHAKEALEKGWIP